MEPQAGELMPLSRIPQKVFRMNGKKSRKVTLEGQVSFQRRLPIELKRRFSKTSRGPKHFHRPPSERPDITQIEKIRQSSLQKKFFGASSEERNVRFDTAFFEKCFGKSPKNYSCMRKQMSSGIEDVAKRRTECMQELACAQKNL